jgi:Protein of unknown function (DUF3307)
MTTVLWLITALLIKHFIWDFYYQPPYMWQNKGTLGHLGGIIHSGVHALTTIIILYQFISPENAVLLGLFEFVVHYITDWAKMNINRIKGWTATTHNEFWQLIGFDQLVHQLTYVAIIALAHVS